MALGDQFSTSSMHWARMCGSVHEIGWGGADPARFCKLVQAGRQPGGATWADRAFKGAMAWMCDDMTYRLASSEGRVIWSIAEGDKFIA